MTEVAAVEELCRALAFYAGRLDRLRRRRDPQLTAYLGGSEPISPWYRIVEPIYAELEDYLDADAELCAEILASPSVRAARADLHRLRACYEFDKELDEAQAVLDSDDPAAALSGLLCAQSYWTLAPAVRDLLATAERVAVAGSGPLPLTALAVASELRARVTCIEESSEACRLARQLVEVSGFADRIDTVEVDVCNMAQLEPYDALLGAALLGSSADGRVVPKTDLLATLVRRVRPGARVIVREPYRLGELYYPPANLAGLDVQRFDPPPNARPYRSSFLVVRPLQEHEGHADSSADPVRA